MANSDRLHVEIEADAKPSLSPKLKSAAAKVGQLLKDAIEKGVDAEVIQKRFERAFGGQSKRIKPVLGAISNDIGVVETQLQAAATDFRTLFRPSAWGAKMRPNSRSR